MDRVVISMMATTMAITVEGETMSLIAFRLTPLDRACEFKILGMKEGQINRSWEGHYSFKASNGVMVKSADSPDIIITPEAMCLYLRGLNRDLDSHIVKETFDDNYQRDEFIEKVKSALKEWADKGGFREATVEEDVSENAHVYTY